MKTILVPTDFSKSADCALSYAVAFAKKEKMSLLLLHACHVAVVTSDVPVDFAYAKIVSDEKEAIGNLKTLQARVKKSGLAKCTILCKQNFALDAILDTIKEKKIAMVIMGTKGASGIKAVVVGSNAAAVIEKAECPVIAVPEKARFSKIRRVVYASDYRMNDLPSLKILIKLIQPFDAKLHIVHVSGGDYIPQSEKEMMNVFVSKIGSRLKYKKITYSIVYGKDTRKKLEEYSKNLPADLLVMSTHHRNLFTHLFGTSLTRKMAYHTDIPLMAFHYKNDPIIFT